MSKIGKKNIVVPKDSSIKISGASLTITGPKGSKTLNVNDKIFSSKLNENEFQITPLNKKIDKKTSIMWGTYRSLINNAIMGVSVGHEKILELNGVGFRVLLKLAIILPCNYSTTKYVPGVCSLLTLLARMFGFLLMHNRYTFYIYNFKNSLRVLVPLP